MSISDRLQEFATSWHEVGDLVGALAAAAAVIFSVVSASRARRDRRRAEAERDAARLEQRSVELEAATDRRERQARAIVVWTRSPAVGVAPADKNVRLSIAEDFYQPVVLLKNYSDMPIFEVVVELTEPDGRVHTWPTVPILHPSDRPSEYRVEDHRSGKGPAGHAIVLFRDAAGRPWHRESDGSLRPS